MIPFEQGMIEAMKTLVVILSNRKNEHLSEAIDSIERNLKLTYPDSSYEIQIVDDSGDEDHYNFLEDLPYKFYKVTEGVSNSGYDKAMQKVHSVFLSQPEFDYLMTWEEDFILERRTFLDFMAKILEHNDDLCQIILKRQPWYENEVRLGGVIEACQEFGDKFTERGKTINYTVHTSHFSNNPNLMPYSIIREFPWPDGERSESRYGQELFSHGLMSSYMGVIKSEPIVTHVGIRSGSGY